jgi:hypothetical protein
MEDNKNLCCEKCSYTANSPSELLRHLNSKKHLRGGVRVNELEYVCNLCDYKTNRPYDIKIHNIRLHSTSDEKKTTCPYYCEICDVGFFAKLFNDKHFKSKFHKNMVEVRRIKELEKN